MIWTPNLDGSLKPTMTDPPTCWDPIGARPYPCSPGAQSASNYICLPHVQAQCSLRGFCMKLRYSLPLVLSLAVSSVNAQGLVTLTDEDGQVVNGTLINGECIYSTDTVSLMATINSSAPLTVNVRRYEIWPVAGSKNFYCWGVCYLPVTSGTNPTWVSQHPVDMNPGASYDNFHSYYQPEGQTGTARFRFVWYDMANPNDADSSWVDIQYCGQVGVEEPMGATTTLTAWPLPSMGQDIQLDYTLDRLSVGNEVVIYTMLGERVRRISLSATQGRVALPASGLVPGVYFANIEREGRVLATRKLIVVR